LPALGGWAKIAARGEHLLGDTMTKPFHSTSRRGAIRIGCARNLLSSAVCVALALGSLPIAQAATHHVVNNADTGGGSLRQAIADANADATLPNTVVFDNTVVSPITLTTGQVAITKGMTIQGPGASKLTISGNDNSRIFYISIASVSDVTISSLTLTHGKTTAVFHGPTGDGGAIYSSNANLHLLDSVLDTNTADGNGGGLLTKGFPSVSITLMNVALLNNKAATAATGGGAFLGAGGDIGAGTISLSAVTVSGNQAGTGGGIAVGGGTATLTNSTLTGNTATWGGAIDADRTSLTLTGGQISGNQASAYGGGISSSGSMLSIARTVISGNTAATDGGGLRIADTFGYAKTINVSDSTLSGNTATGGHGGAIAIDSDPNESVTLTNTTLSGNHALAGTGGGIYSNIGYKMPIPNGSGSLMIESSTIAGNSAHDTGGVLAAASSNGAILHNTIIANSATGGGLVSANMKGAFTANFNFFSDTTGATLFTTGGNLTGNPQLGPLGINGGPTPTMLPAGSSPVLNAGDPAYADNPPKDQRGLPRKFGAAIDIGAVERRNPEDIIFRDGFGP